MTTVSLDISGSDIAPLVLGELMIDYSFHLDANGLSYVDPRVCIIIELPNDMNRGKTARVLRDGIVDVVSLGMLRKTEMHIKGMLRKTEMHIKCI
jgi:hypothetical protein